MAKFSAKYCLQAGCVMRTCGSYVQLWSYVIHENNTIVTFAS